jgi:transmembrane sensor
MNYRNFTVEDFLSDIYFQRWILAPDDQNTTFWEQWVQENPDKKLVFEKAERIARNIDFSEKWSDEERSDMWSNIQLGMIHDEIPQSNIFRISQRKIWLVAASLVFILASIGIFKSNPGMKETSTAFGQIKKITLADGSVITLNANSRLKYAKDFLGKGEREIWVDGEAFFEVNKRVVAGEKVPFTVHARDLSIQVLGTAFNISNRRGTVNVALEHGQVKVVDQNNTKNAVLLKPGESVTQSEKAPSLLKEKVDVDSYFSWKNKVIVFKKKSLNEIAEMMKDLYNIEVVIDNPALESETFTGSFPTDSSAVLFEKLEKMFPLEVTKNGDSYHLK